MTNARPDLLAAIRKEIFRLRADEGSVGPVDAIYVGDRGNGKADLHGSARGPAFYWFGSAQEILERLSTLQDGGPEVIRSEFHTGI
jgi:hypothetical protein